MQVIFASCLYQTLCTRDRRLSTCRFRRITDSCSASALSLVSTPHSFTRSARTAKIEVHRIHFLKRDRARLSKGENASSAIAVRAHVLVIASRRHSSFSSLPHLIDCPAIHHLSTETGPNSRTVRGFVVHTSVTKWGGVCLV
jgi:hypothetical protein